MPRPRASCPTCGSPVPKRARFCPECGTRIAGDGTTAVLETPPEETTPAPVAYAASEPRLFGVTPPMAVFALGVAALAVAVVLLVTGRWLPGGLALAAAILLLATFAEVARRKPSGAVARVSGGALARIRSRAVYAVDAFATRSRAGRDVARVRRELLDLGAERDRRVRELGEAVYRDDRKGTKQLRAELIELEARVAQKEAEMGAIAAEARAHVERARLEIRPTEMVEIPEPPSPSPDPDPSPQPEPPTPSPVPEPGPIPPVPEPYPPPDEATPPEPARIPEPGPLDDAREKNS